MPRTASVTGRRKKYLRQSARAVWKLQIAVQRLRFVAVARAVDRRDEAEDRAVADERRRGLAEVEREPAGKRSRVSSMIGVADDEERLELVLERVALHADRRLRGGASC